ncbi:hypothetical protein GGX14DRAFT_559049 [Mycena pura]|uniref:Uncharacterized protein n=1 Tax=Mycena pura TaxID=153505 RepID=A0AAD6VSN4_9AGAR|nr:hypothetical protein GGX14DRAFT_559049 [Mycena pura]
MFLLCSYLQVGAKVGVSYSTLHIKLLEVRAVINLVLPKAAYHPHCSHITADTAALRPAACRPAVPAACPPPAPLPIPPPVLLHHPSRHPAAHCTAVPAARPPSALTPLPIPPSRCLSGPHPSGGGWRGGMGSGAGQWARAEIAGRAGWQDGETWAACFH